MITESTEPILTLSITRIFKASPETVFKAFTDPQWYEQWWGPEGMTSKVRQFDLRVGGAFRVDMHGPDGHVMTLYGQFRRIEPPRLLEHTFAWEGEGHETTVTIEFEPHEDGTELTVTHSGFTDQDRAGEHEFGWVSSFDGLDAFLLSH